MPRFQWDGDKARRNLAKHGVAFEDAELVWSDALHLLRFDHIEDGEERWHALGKVGGVVLILVVHTESDDVVRIVSARRATKNERKAYDNDDF